MLNGSQQQATAAQQIEQLTATLNQAFVRKADAEAVVKEADLQIVAIRNVLGGVGLGQKLQKEVDATQAANVPPASPEVPHHPV